MYALCSIWERSNAVSVSYDSNFISRRQWLKSNPNIARVTIGLNSIVAIVSFLLLDSKAQIVVVPFGLLALGYAFPFLNKGKKSFRELWGLKIFLIAISWTGVTALLPIISSSQNITLLETIYLVAERFVFILAITLPFDIRDIEYDMKAGMTTIPSILGEYKSMLLSVALLILWCAVGYFAFDYISAIILTFAFTLAAILLSYKRRNDYFYLGVLDGTMILFFLLLKLM